MQRDPALDHAGRQDRPDSFTELAALTDRVVALRVITKMQKEGTLPPALTQPKNPKMRGLIDSMAKFRHQVDCDIDDASKMVESAHVRRKEVFTKVSDHIGDQVSELGDFSAHFDELEAAIGDNGAPSSGGGSKESPKEPVNSTVGDAAI